MAEKESWRPYRPSNGTEGIAFDGGFCDKCVHDRAYREDPYNNDGCPLIANALAFEIGHPKYPKEWRYVMEDDDEFGQVCVPTCTKFSEIVLVERCKFTVDMFDNNGGLNGK